MRKHYLCIAIVNGENGGVWGRLSNFVPYFTGYVITFPWWDCVGCGGNDVEICCRSGWNRRRPLFYIAHHATHERPIGTSVPCFQSQLPAGVLAVRHYYGLLSSTFHGCPYRCPSAYRHPTAIMAISRCNALTDIIARITVTTVEMSSVTFMISSGGDKEFKS